jgi:transposase
MLKKDYIEEILSLKDAILKKAERKDGILHIHIKMHQRIHECPECGELTSLVHDYREQNIKDISSLGDHTVIHLRKRRHRCPVCEKKFYESIDFLPRYRRITNRLNAYIVHQCHSVYAMKSVAQMCNISQTTVARIFDHVDYPKPKLPKVLSVDEFRGNAGGEKFQCILTDPDKRNVLDILPRRNLDDICGYFTGFDDRSLVEFIVMDMSPLFKSMARSCFPKAIIIADKYHVKRIVDWAFEAVRKQEQKKFMKERRIYFKRSRKLLLKNRNLLTDDEVFEIEHILKVSERIREAYLIKMKFDEFMASKDSHSARKRLSAWIVFVQGYDLPEFDSCCKTFINWSKEILAMFDNPYSNGYTEGVNNKIKVLKRNAFGVRNFDRFRNRILHVMT